MSPSLRTAAAGLLLRSLARRLPMRIAYPDGKVTGAEGPIMRLRRPRELRRRLGDDGEIGLGESYQAGDWDSDDLPALLTAVATGLAGIAPALQKRLWRLRRVRPPRAEEGTLEAAPSNAGRHYDLPNEMFASFLDRSMTYSSALFASRDDDLTEAQHRKIDRLLDVARVGAGSHLLEIGTGWGELAIRAARRGARVVSVTLSEQQRRLAVERLREAGVADRVEVRRCDYREVEPAPDGFDAVVSVEMVEAVGYDYWPAFAEAVLGHLRPGGRAGIQLITTDHERMLATVHAYTWIQKHIFPGGLVPSAEAIEAAFTAAGGLVEERFDFGSWHYAETLRRWRAAGEHDRTWDYYLSFCEAGFRAGYLDVSQLVVVSPERATAECPPRGDVSERTDQ
ncbi:cyclopropane-fatty-acyl-phospholipid synthase family protein [Actinoplanes sp. NPDC089786]|uniref:cyclopropane-fatty-acyl-phospholipid synthase family protein n=1 Tax=Actinoplanes sp. NPDC089786 TaxID=3155185 RepID=UPI00341320DB